LSDEFVVLGVASNPEPQNSILIVDTDGSVVQTDASGPKFTDALEMYGGMPWISLHLGKTPVGEPLYFWR